MNLSAIETYRASETEKARTEDLLRILPRGRASILEIGALDGHFSKLLTQYFPSVTALDLKKPDFEYPGIVTVAGDATQLDFPDNAFDCIFCTEVLEHIPAFEKACRELARVVRHEIVIGVPFKQDIRYGRATCGSCRGINPPWGHVNSFDEDRLLQLFSGMRLVSKSFVGTSREVTNSLAVLLLDFAGNPWGTYNIDHACLHCGKGLAPPDGKMSLPQKLCSALALRMNQLQSRWTKPRSNWIHLVLSKT